MIPAEVTLAGGSAAAAAAAATTDAVNLALSSARASQNARWVAKLSFLQGKQKNLEYPGERIRNKLCKNQNMSK